MAGNSAAFTQKHRLCSIAGRAAGEVVAAQLLSLHAHDFHNLKKSAQSTVTGDAPQRTPGKQSRRKFPGTGECKEMHEGRKLLMLIPFMYNNQRF
jgi:hypothetical protein